MLLEDIKDCIPSRYAVICWEYGEHVARESESEMGEERPGLINCIINRASERTNELSGVSSSRLSDAEEPSDRCLPVGFLILPRPAFEPLSRISWIGNYPRNNHDPLPRITKPPSIFPSPLYDDSTRLLYLIYTEGILELSALSNIGEKDWK